MSEQKFKLGDTVVSKIDLYFTYLEAEDGRTAHLVKVRAGTHVTVAGHVSGIGGWSPVILEHGDIESGRLCLTSGHTIAGQMYLEKV